MIRLTLDEVFALCKEAVLACGATEVNAASLAWSIREAEAAGIRNVGLGFMPYYCDHLLKGAIVGDAEPEVFDKSPAVGLAPLDRMVVIVLSIIVLGCIGRTSGHDSRYADNPANLGGRPYRNYVCV